MENENEDEKQMQRHVVQLTVTVQMGLVIKVDTSRAIPMMVSIMISIDSYLCEKPASDRRRDAKNENVRGCSAHFARESYRGDGGEGVYTGLSCPWRSRFRA